MNRRQFLTILGGTVAAIAAKPVLAVVPAANPIANPCGAASQFLSLDEINAIAFSIHASAFPENATYYRGRVLEILRRRQASR